MKHPSLKLTNFLSEPLAKQPRKRLFIGLVSLSTAVLCFFLLLGWLIPLIGLGNIHPSIPYITGFLLIFSIMALVWSALLLILQVTTNINYFGSSKARGLANKFFLPIMEILAKLSGISTDEVRRSFIKINNELTCKQHALYPADKILILLPHCIQNASCAIRISYTIDACKRCGKCPVSELIELRNKYGVRLAIATGGSIARRIVIDTKPSLIIAVACERDLTSGIQDSFPLPVYGILNHRPEGPCINTLVSIPLLEEAILRFSHTPTLLDKQKAEDINA